MFKVGDPVWAKMKGFPPWPAKICPPSPSVKQPKKKSHFVYFFGSENYAWILEENITPHSKSMLIDRGTKKSAQFKDAVNAFLEYSLSLSHKSPKSILNEVQEILKPKSPIKEVRKAVKKKREREEVITPTSVESRSITMCKKRPLCGDNGIPDPTECLKVKDGFSSSLNHVPHYPLLNFEELAKEIRSDVNLAQNQTRLRLGFIGLGMMGQEIVKCFIEVGYQVSVWNRTSSVCEPFVALGAKKVTFPSDLLVDCDITFCCVSEIEASKKIFYSEQGVLRGLKRASDLGLKGRGYVELSNIDADTSRQLAEVVKGHGGRYLEAPICGSSKDAKERGLAICATGDIALFHECAPIFTLFSKTALYCGCDVGKALTLSIIVSMYAGTCVAALGEAMALCERLKLQKSDLMEMIQNGPLNFGLLRQRGEMMTQNDFRKETPLKVVQKDMALGLSMGDKVSQPMPVVAMANEVFKRGKMSNYSDEDMSAVYKVAKY